LADLLARTYARAASSSGRRSVKDAEGELVRSSDMVQEYHADYRYSLIDS